MTESKAFTLNKTDWQKIIKGLGIAMGGAGAAYLLGILDVIDVGYLTPLVTAGLSALLNAILKLIQGQTS